MARAKAKKKKMKTKSPIKAAFLYGTPNKGKLSALIHIQEEYTRLCNWYIGKIQAMPQALIAVIKNDRKDSGLRALEKELRPEGVNSAFSQNAFDNALCHLSNRLNDIRLEILRDEKQAGEDVPYAQSKVLFAMCLMGRTKQSMEDVFRAFASVSKQKKEFYTSIADALHGKSPEEFSSDMRILEDAYAAYSLEFKVPVLKKEQVLLDSRLMKVEESKTTKEPYVFSITDPFHKKSRIEIPVGTSKRTLRRLKQHKAAGSVSYTVTKDGKVRIQWAFTKTVRDAGERGYVGVDTGINDCFHTSDGKVFGSMHGVIQFYKDEVEPSFGGLSGLRNKKKKILHYVRTHKNLPEDVRRSLIGKADRLEKQVRTTSAPYRKKRHYYQLLGHEVKQSVEGYINTLSDGDVTVIEQLDIKEFKKSRRLNGELSVFARGRLQEALMEALQWKGYSFLEVAPEFTSQACPVCCNLDKGNRDGKTFQCTCCGYKADADHVGAINIRARAIDKELARICEENAYSKAGRAKSLKAYYLEKHEAWKKEQEKKKNEAVKTLRATA